MTPSCDARRAWAVRAATAPRARSSRARACVELLARRDHRQHHAQLVAGRGLEQGGELVIEQRGPPQARAAHRERPSAGLASVSGCQAAGLSPPTSSVRKTTGRPGIAARIRR